MAEEPNFYRLADRPAGRLAFLPFLRLQAAARAFGEAKTPLGRARALQGMLALRGEDLPRALPLEAWADALDSLWAENAAPVPLAWQRATPGLAGKPAPAPESTAADYTGREVAQVVALLAGAFGWSAEAILYRLTPGEVAAYVQEALLREHEQRAFAYALSESVGVRRVGQGATAEYIKDPFPDLPWMRRALPEAGGPLLPPKYRPDGVIVDFTQRDASGNAVRYELPLTNPQAESAGSPASSDGPGAVGSGGAGGSPPA